MAVDAPSPNSTTSFSATTQKPRYHVQSIDDSYTIYGVDAIWHNMYCGNDSDFITFRKPYDCTIDQMLLLVARQVEVGLYSIISMSASVHQMTVVCACEKMQNELFRSGTWDDPAFEGVDLACPVRQQGDDGENTEA